MHHEGVWMLPYILKAKIETHALLKHSNLLQFSDEHFNKVISNLICQVFTGTQNTDFYDFSLSVEQYDTFVSLFLESYNELNVGVALCNKAACTIRERLYDLKPILTV